ncbi:MAG: transcription termination/antitermination NusG family protein [Ferruginibacter sp.]
MENTTYWHAVYTKPRWEKKVAALLEARGIEYYCPLNKVVKQWSDRKKVVLEPLFKSYVFVHVEEAKKMGFTEYKRHFKLCYLAGQTCKN